MLLMPEVLTITILNVIFVFFSIVAFIFSIKIYLDWDIESTSQKQYNLEKNSFLTAVIVKYILLLKLPLFGKYIEVLHFELPSLKLVKPPFLLQ